MPEINFSNLDQDGFTTISNSFVRNSNLSLQSRGLMMILLSHSKEWKITLRNLAKDAGIGRDTCGKYIKELIDFGYIVRIRRRNKNGLLTHTDYYFSCDIEKVNRFKKQLSINTDNKPMSENPTLDEKPDKQPKTENPTLDFPTQEKPTTLKEKEVKEKEVKENNSLLTRIENFKNEAEMVYNNHKESFPKLDLKAYLNYWTEYSPGEMMFKAEKTCSFNHFNRFISWNDKEPKFAPKTGKNDNSNRITDGNELRNYFRQQAIEAEKNK